MIAILEIGLFGVWENSKIEEFWPLFVLKAGTFDPNWWLEILELLSVSKSIKGPL